MFEIFNTIITNPVTNLLVIFYQIFASIGIPYTFTFSIIALTIAIRFILWPLTASQIRSAAKMQKVAPQISDIREKYKGDNKKQQEEIMKLYRESGVNPAAGCLPLLLQIPIFYGLYHVLDVAVKTNSDKALMEINKILYFDFLKLDRVWDTTLFGLNLGDSPYKLISSAPLLLVIPLSTAGFQFLLSKMMMPEAAMKAEEKIVKATKPKEDDFQVALQKQSMYFLPIMFGFLSIQFPIGLSLYWNTFTLFGILQQYILVGPGAVGPWVRKIRRKG